MKLLQILSPLLSTIIPSLFSPEQDTEYVTQRIATATLRPVSIELKPWFNNRAVGPDANFDHHSGHYWASELLPTGTLKVGSVDFTLPLEWDGSFDNVVSDGQVLPAPYPVRFAKELHVLYAGDFIDGETGAHFTFHFEDGTQQTVEASIHNWWNLHWINTGGAIQTPYHYKPGGEKDYNITQIFLSVLPRGIVFISLP
ncbi:uncharacterized protein EI90DRAFT_1383367 [Cantharellus anzutake]|uniref:uncharacterized protein n=1 Tax=Cantharellus anzutake TaxID=1750568 RepID=UPI001908D57D|nr:uncharacterized protein EI90DRAFT_1383367 [Cantharellus anzutake]KAF8329348.1 hypothetical protein EI90DRAFT_1383367 [Cantharellus anzutake]